MQKPDSTARISDTTGTVWAYIQNLAARGITLIVFFVLVRLLSPTEFGSFAVAMVFLTLGEVFVEQLFGPAIVQRETLSEAHLSSAFWATLVLATILVLATLTAAPFFARAFGAPGVEPIIMALTPVFIFMALASIPSALLYRDLDYRTLARRTVLSNLLSGTVAIAAAVGGLGVWTFVLQQLVYQAVSTWILWHHEAWRPHKAFNLKALRELFGFTTRITLSKILDMVETRVVELVIAQRLGIISLGNYALATRAQQAATQLLSAPLQVSSIPIFARKQADRPALIAALQDRTLLASLLIMPVFLFAAGSADALVPAVFGAQWHEAVAPFQILCLLGAVRSISGQYSSMLQAIGAAGPMLKNGVVRTTVTVAALPFLLAYGPAGVAGSILLGQLIMLPFLFQIVASRLGLNLMGLFSNVAKPIVSGCIAATVGVLFVGWLEVTYGWQEGTIWQLTCAIGALTASVIVFLILVLFGMPRTLLPHAKKLSPKFSTALCAALAAIIRLEDALHVRLYFVLLNSGSAKPAPGRDDIILLLSDTYSIGGSLGDQALLGGLTKLLRQAGIARARVLCRPGVVLPAIEGIAFEAIPLWGGLAKARILANELVGARGLVVVGADVLDGFYSRLESLLRLGIADFAARHSIPTVLCSFSFNDQPDPATVSAFKKLPVDVKILCRDTVSRDRLAHFVGNRVQLMADVAYLLSPSTNGELESRISAWLAQGHRSAGPLIGWNLSPHTLQLLSPEQQETAIKSSAEVIGHLVKDRNARVVLIPHDFRAHASDPEMLGDIYSRLPPELRDSVLLVQGPYTAADVKQACARFDLVFTGRMHLMIASLGSDVPVLVVQYQGKCSGALAHFGLGDSHLLEPIDICSAELLHRRLCERLDELHQTRTQIKSLRPIVEALSSKIMLECLGAQL